MESTLSGVGQASLTLLFLGLVTVLALVGVYALMWVTAGLFGWLDKTDATPTRRDMFFVAAAIVLMIIYVEG